MLGHTGNRKLKPGMARVSELFLWVTDREHTGNNREQIAYNLFPVFPVRKTTGNSYSPRRYWLFPVFPV